MVYFRFNNLFRVMSRYCGSNNFIKKGTITDKLVLYGDEASPPVRCVMMTASMLNIDLKFHFIDIFKGENKSVTYTKVNPLQKVPVLQVGSDVICDSHAISLYLCQISDNDSLYPSDPLSRARVNQLMFFNSSTLFPIDSLIFTNFFLGMKTAYETKIEQWYSALDYLEHELSNSTWLAGDKVTLGDLCCGTTVSSLQLLVPPLDRHHKIKQWMKKQQELPCYEINTRGLERLEGFIDIFK